MKQPRGLLIQVWHCHLIAGTPKEKNILEIYEFSVTWSLCLSKSQEDTKRIVELTCVLGCSKCRFRYPRVGTPQTNAAKWSLCLCISQEDQEFNYILRCPKRMLCHLSLDIPENGNTIGFASGWSLCISLQDTELNHTSRSWKLFLGKFQVYALQPTCGHPRNKHIIGFSAEWNFCKSLQD